ncbi:hypothetical protein Tco_0401258 [Tanacetum coccineum]
MDVSKDSTRKDDASSLFESIKTNSLASKISNIDGKFLPRRCTTYQEPLKDAVPSKSTNSNVKEKVDTHGKPSFASVIHEKPQKTIVKIKELRNETSVHGAAVTLPMEAVESVNARFVNTLYGYFIGDRLAFPLVENYVKNTWAKYGLKRIQLHEEFFLFQFNTREGMESVLENGPWLIRRVPLLLNEWTTNTILKKDEIKQVPVWVKMHHVPIVAYSDVSLSPLLYSDCDKCPKLPKVAPSEKVTDDGFTEVKKKKAKANKNIKKQVEGIRLNKPPLNLQYRRVDRGESSNQKTNEVASKVATDLEDDDRVNAGNESQFVNDSDEDVDEYITMVETSNSVHKVGNDISSPKQTEVGQGIIVGGRKQIDMDVAVIHQDPQRLCGMGCVAYELPINQQNVVSSWSFVLHIFRGSLIFYLEPETVRVKDGIASISDHSPSVLSIPSRVKEKPKPFKIFNVVLLDDRFKDMVRNGWLVQVSGFYMFRVVKKLKGLKKPIRKLMYDKGNLHANVVRLREELDKVQTDLDNDPSNLSLREKEAATVVDFNEALLMEEKFLKQKEVNYLVREGGYNLVYFQKVVKSHVSRSRIDVVTDANGAVYHNNDVAKAFINHYEVFLGQPGNTSDLNTDNLFPTRLNDSEALNMVRDISSQEVKSAMFSMGNDKSPGPNGFTAGFFKDTWDIIGADVIKAVSEFFTNGRLLKELNHTIIALIPKVNTPARVNDYRPDFIVAFINGSLHGYFKGKRGLRQELDLINLCFANDLFLFVHGDVNSAKVIKEALDDFKDASGLIRNRVNDWKTKSLSIAGRLQLIQSVLGSLHVYWASVFMLPTRVLLDIEQIMRGFLWCHGSMCRGKAKVAWDVVCLPKQEGGLGVRRLDHFNKALMVSHVWKLLSLKESLWVKWIHVYKLNNRSFWDIPYRGTMSWSWRKLLLLRPLIREFIWSCIGDGKTTSIWFDKCRESRNSNRSLCNALVKPFSVHNVWDSIRPRDNLVSWYDFVWFHACIPRHAFNMWLIFKKRLRTQDCLRSWEVVAGLAVFAGLTGAGPSFASIVTHLMPIAMRKSSKSCIGKLVVAAATYFVWQERNARLFNKVKRSVTDVVDSIISVVRLKLLSCRFKKSKEAILFARLWEIPMSNLK